MGCVVEPFRRVARGDSERCHEVRPVRARILPGARCDARAGAREACPGGLLGHELRAARARARVGHGQHCRRDGGQDPQIRAAHCAPCPRQLGRRRADLFSRSRGRDAYKPPAWEKAICGQWFLRRAHCRGARRAARSQRAASPSPAEAAGCPHRKLLLRRARRRARRARRGDHPGGVASMAWAST